MNTLLPSFDGNESVTSELVRPDRYRDLFSVLKSQTPVIARGAGLTYCGASAGDNVTSVSNLLLNRILDFDAQTGLITVESGLRVGDLFDFVTTRGWFPTILPGHPKITVGGCAGFNIHGKSQFHSGNFIDSVQSIQLFHPDHGELSCNRDENADLFYLTLGGFGLTGFITQLMLRLTRLKGNAIRTQRIRVRNLIDAVDQMESQKGEVDTLYSWNDLNFSNHKFGQGILYSEKFIKINRSWRKNKTVDLHPSRTSNRFPFYSRFSSKAMTRVYGFKEKLGRREKIQELKRATFPIHGKEIYYKLFGSSGLREYQMLVPHSSWKTVVSEFQKQIQKHRVGVTLGSLKLFKGNTTLLNFSGTGVCFTLNVPSNSFSENFFKSLDQIILSVGGIANISKDSRLESATVEKMYPEFQKFKSQLQKFDPNRRFDSSLRRRLDV